MAELWFTIPSEALAQSREALPQEALEGPVVAKWLDAGGTQVGEAVVIRSAPALQLEHPTTDGALGWSAAARSPTFASDPPDEAVTLSLVRGGAQLAQLERIDLSTRRKLPKPRLQRVGPPAAGFVVPIISERFETWEEFVGHVQTLRNWVVAQAPFDLPGVGDQVAFDAHFWPSDPEHGLFETTDAKSQDGQLFYGERDLARALLQPWLGGADISLILINSTMRGGAGGQPGWSAWASITATGSERWEAVALHEIGHGLGLGDEYVQDSRAGEWRDDLEPNISRDFRPSQTSWSALANLPDADVPSFDGRTEHLCKPSDIGTFQGARYRLDHFRPTKNCLMRATSKPFCAVCRAHIVAKLQGRGGLEN